MKNLVLIVAAVFTIGTQAGFGDNFLQKLNIECSSSGGYEKCHVGGTILKSKVKSISSQQRCQKGDTYGVDILGGYIWVDQGCKIKVQLRGLNLVDIRDTEPVWFCTASGITRDFHGQGSKRKLAELDAIKKCEKKYHPMHCKIVSCEQE